MKLLISIFSLDHDGPSPELEVLEKKRPELPAKRPQKPAKRPQKPANARKSGNLVNLVV